jgi:hypothetical protein
VATNTSLNVILLNERLHCDSEGVEIINKMTLPLPRTEITELKRSKRCDMSRWTATNARVKGNVAE